MRNELYRRLCQVGHPTSLLEVFHDVESQHPYRRFVGNPDRLKGCEPPVVLYGAGRFGRSVITAWRRCGVEPTWCVDSSEGLQGQKVLGVPVRPPSSLLECGQPPVVVVAAMHTHRIQEWLRTRHISPLFAELDGSIGCLPGHRLATRAKDFVHIWETLHDEKSKQVFLAAAKARLFQEIWFDMTGSPFLHAQAEGAQYCVPDICRYDDRRQYVDCGAYEGDFLLSLGCEMSRRGDGTIRAHAFEGDSENVARVRATVRTYGLDHVMVYHNLVGEKDQMVESPDFHNCREGGRAAPVQMVRLDSVLPDIDVGFIKMDIEGEEVRALRGAQGIIKNQHPYLAICAYHCTDHLLDVPLAIKASGRRYALHLRHHSTNTLWETVCYARPM